MTQNLAPEIIVCASGIWVVLHQTFRRLLLSEGWIGWVLTSILGSLMWFFTGYNIVSGLCQRKWFKTAQDSISPIQTDHESDLPLLYFIGYGGTLVHGKRVWVLEYPEKWRSLWPSWSLASTLCVLCVARNWTQAKCSTTELHPLPHIQLFSVFPYAPLLGS